MEFMLIVCLHSKNTNINVLYLVKIPVFFHTALYYTKAQKTKILQDLVLSNIM